ncbi:hypothetical protein ASD04_07085 [Devosia sp. Root436]|uniref:hypothetical protein n=1 Tax=Devosia sp. Root436 TaxID=1736537 RepID=UPI0006FC710B|nr:hypothetical protein [Devosia sp. Root436]KQX40387.1 hypothetical protein ASD04_07085 [Devosia sp. Root436]
MITDAEFVLAKSFDRDLAQATGSAQVIINRKNVELAAARRIIAKLQRDLAASEARYADLQRQITRAALQ